MERKSAKEWIYATVAKLFEGRTPHGNWPDIEYNLHNSVIGQLVQCSGRHEGAKCLVEMEIIRRREDGSIKEKLILYSPPPNSIAWDCNVLRTTQGQAIKEFMS